jgi:hypothetical protein
VTRKNFIRPNFSIQNITIGYIGLQEVKSGQNALFGGI